MEKFARRLSEEPVGDPDAAFVMVEWHDPGGSSADEPVAPLHIHYSGEEAWYVLEGALGVRLGDDVHIVEAGTAVVARRGTPHTFWNAGQGPCRYMVVMTPEIQSLIEALHAPNQSRDRASLEELFATHQSHLV